MAFLICSFLTVFFAIYAIKNYRTYKVRRECKIIIAKSNNVVSSDQKHFESFYRISYSFRTFIVFSVLFLFLGICVLYQTFFIYGSKFENNDITDMSKEAFVSNNKGVHFIRCGFDSSKELNKYAINGISSIGAKNSKHNYVIHIALKGNKNTTIKIDSERVIVAAKYIPGKASKLIRYDVVLNTPLDLMPYSRKYHEILYKIENA